MQMYTSGPRGAVDSRQIRSTLPYIRTEIPVVVIFRALGFVADRYAYCLRRNETTLSPTPLTPFPTHLTRAAAT